MEDLFIVSNIRETYHELGDYEFKVVLSPKHFKSSHSCGFILVDSDGKRIPGEVGRWGRKVIVKFKIDEGVSDGVAALQMSLVLEDGRKINRQLTWWVIKP
jgi:hypothetical protein